MADDLRITFIRYQSERFVALRRQMEGVLAQLDDEGVNWRAGADINSVANLVTHLSGNLNQRFGVLNGEPDGRDRPKEFEKTLRRSREELTLLVSATFAKVEAVLGAMPPERLAGPHVYRGREWTVMEAIASASEHLALHVGQMILLAKLRLGEGYRYMGLPATAK